MSGRLGTGDMPDKVCRFFATFRKMNECLVLGAGTARLDRTDELVSARYHLLLECLVLWVSTSFKRRYDVVLNC